MAIITNRNGHKAGALARALRRKNLSKGDPGFNREDIEVLICEGLTPREIDARLGCGLWPIQVVMRDMKKLGFEITG